MKSFKNFLNKKLMEQLDSDWKKEYISLKKGFVPPSNLKPIVQAFVNSGDVPLIDDTSSKIKMPKKSLFLVGGSTRDFLLGKKHEDLDLVTNATPEQTVLILKHADFKDGDSHGNKKVYINEQDSSSVIAVVNDEEFVISTFKKINKDSEIEFVDNPKEDAERRDLTINSLYIELSKAEGENNKLYDPTGHGYHDLNNNKIRSVGDPDKKIEEDKSRAMRTIRFHSKFGKEELDSDLSDAILKNNDLDGVDSKKISQEFIKGLEDYEIDKRKYIKNYKKYGLLNKLLPDVSLNTKIPNKLKNEKDKFLILAWILQNNPIENVEKTLNNFENISKKPIVAYLLKLKNFDLDNIDDLVKQRNNLGITKEQIHKWVDLFDVVGPDNVYKSNPKWAKKIKCLSTFNPDYSKLINWNVKDEMGNPTTQIHPEIIARNLSNMPKELRNSVVKDINKNKIIEMFRNHLKNYTF